MRPMRSTEGNRRSTFVPPSMRFQRKDVFLGALGFDLVCNLSFTFVYSLKATPILLVFPSRITSLSEARKETASDRQENESHCGEVEGNSDAGCRPILTAAIAGNAVTYARAGSKKQQRSTFRQHNCAYRSLRRAGNWCRDQHK